MHGISPFVSKDTRPSILPEGSRALISTNGPSASSENAASTDTRASRGETSVADQDAVQKHDISESSPSFRVRRMVLSKTSSYNPAIHRKLQELSRLLNHTKPAQQSGILRKAQLLQQSQLEMDNKSYTRDRRAVRGKMPKGNPGANRAGHRPKVSQHDEPVQKKRIFRKVQTLPLSEPAANNMQLRQHSAHDVASVEHDRTAQESDQVPQLEPLQQQLQELAEQVKALKHAFDTMISKSESSIPSVVDAASGSKQGVPHASTLEAKADQPLARSLPVSLRSPVEAARHGHGVYRSSTIALANIVKSLEADPSFTAGQIGKRIRARLAIIARQAVQEDDRSMRETLLATSMFEKDTSRSGKRRAIKMVPPIRPVYLETNKDRRKYSPDQTMPVKTQESSAVTDSSVTHEAVGLVRAAECDQATKFSRDGADRAQANADRVNEEGPEPKLSHARSLSSPSPASIDNPVGRTSNIKGPSHQTSTARASDATEQSLLEELFPEANAPVSNEPVEDKVQYPKLHPPSSNRLIRPETVKPPKDPKQQIVDSFTKSGENITVLQLQHCSTELSESDFRRLIPKGKHIEVWNRDGAYYKVIPGRNPISLERLPFYYILFKSAESAYAYQNNVTRLHKLAALHQPTNIFSAIPAPRGFLEDGEDIDAVTSSYLLRPTEHAPAIRTLMQPYHPGLRSLFTQGGYTPIVPDVDDKRNRMYRVLMHIEGYEPSLTDLFTVFRRDAAIRGLPLPLRNESITSLHRLRDLVNLKTHVIPVATTNPRAYDSARSRDADPPVSTDTKIEYEDPNIAYFMKNDDPVDQNSAKEINQIIMNQVYNRWILEFDDEDEARRFTIAWHRRALPDLSKTERTWKDYEEARMCNTELLW